MVDKQDVKTTVIKAGGSSLASSLLPALAIAGAGYLVYKAVQDTGETLSGIGGSGSSFYESIKETVTDAAGGTEDPASVYNIVFNPEALPESENQEIYQDNPDPETRTATGTAGEWADFLTKGPIGSAFDLVYLGGTALNPMSEDLKQTQIKYGSGDFSAKDIADSNSLYAKLFLNKSSYASKSAEVNSIDVSTIKTASQAESMGLGLAPLAVNANPKIDSNAVSQKETNKSLAAKVKSSGMPASNLKNATSVSTVTDKSGKERIKIKYKNGVTLRY